MMNQVNGVNEVNGEFGESVDFVSVDVECKKGQKVKSDFSKKDDGLMIVSCIFR